MFVETVFYKWSFMCRICALKELVEEHFESTKSNASFEKDGKNEKIS